MGWRRSSGETGFPRKRAYCSGSVWVLPRRLWSRGEVASFEDGSDPPKRPWSRRRAYRTRSTWARRGGGGAQGKQVFHGSGHVVQDRLGACWDDCGVVKRAYRSKSAWVSPRRLRGREAACRSGPALPACCRTSPLRTRKWSSPRLVCRRRTNLTLVSSEVIEMVRF